MYRTAVTIGKTSPDRMNQTPPVRLVLLGLIFPMMTAALYIIPHIMFISQFILSPSTWCHFDHVTDALALFCPRLHDNNWVRIKKRVWL